MLYNTISLWLSSPDDYQAGLALLRDTGFKSAFTLSILETGDDAYNRNRLETELRKWLEQEKSTQNNVLPIAAPATRFSEDNLEPGNARPGRARLVPISPLVKSLLTEGKPAGVLDIEQRIGSLMDERAEAKASLRALEYLGNDDAACAQRLPYAQRVKQNTRAIDELYSQLDFFNEHGYLPPLASDPATVVDDRTTLLNMRSYVSRYTAKLRQKNLTPEQRQSAEKLLKQYSDEKTRLELKLIKQPNDSCKTGQQTSDRPIHHSTFSGA